MRLILTYFIMSLFYIYFGHLKRLSDERKIKRFMKNDKRDRVRTWLIIMNTMSMILEEAHTV